MSEGKILKDLIVEFKKGSYTFSKMDPRNAHLIGQDELRKAVKDGKIDTGSKVEVDAEITIKNLNVSHKLNGTLTAPD